MKCWRICNSCKDIHFTQPCTLLPHLTQVAILVSGSVGSPYWLTYYAGISIWCTIIFGAYLAALLHSSCRYSPTANSDITSGKL